MKGCEMPFELTEIAMWKVLHSIETCRNKRGEKGKKNMKENEKSSRKKSEGARKKKGRGKHNPGVHQDPEGDHAAHLIPRRIQVTTQADRHVLQYLRAADRTALAALQVADRIALLQVTVVDQEVDLGHRETRVRVLQFEIDEGDRKIGIMWRKEIPGLHLWTAEKGMRTN